MTKEEFLSRVWGYYIMLENNFMDTFVYVEPVTENNDTFSKEYGNLLLSIGSEIDVVCKELCKIIENKTAGDVSRYNVVDYKNVISGDGNFMNESCVYLINCEVLQPWLEWNTVDRPSWWKNYNSLKHDRLNSDNYKLGNYSNVKDALSALYIITRILYKKMFSFEPIPKSNLFQMKDWTTYNKVGNGFYHVLSSNGGMSLVHFKE